MRRPETHDTEPIGLFELEDLASQLAAAGNVALLAKPVRSFGVGAQRFDHLLEYLARAAQRGALTEGDARAGIVACGPGTRRSTWRRYKTGEALQHVRVE